MSTPASPLVSIVIVNFNYGRFLPAAIESALGQTYERVQVLIVDDGSTDDSHAIIERYAGRVVRLLKDNGGQGSAFNHGFQRASGDVVIFLDADDVLGTDTAAGVAAAFGRRPDLAKVHYRLRLIDEGGQPTGAVVPPSGLRLPSGDLRRVVRLHPDDVPYPPASGNAYAAWALRRLLPMPEREYRLLADVYLLNLAPMLGPVELLEGTGGSYRVHGGNSHFASSLRLDRVRATIEAIHITHVHMKALADSMGMDGFPEPLRDNRSLVFLSQRMISCKLDPGPRAFPGDSLTGLVRRGILAASRRTDLAPGLRLLYGAWFLAIALAPRRPAARLAEQMLYFDRRGRLAALVERLRRFP